ncbi:protein tamozhennic isoform X1 [Periplaneta americana]|uniref:protein tamozhennic isoform X1 n=2 Tax=Periplaneta americana TaxID=6978 RepID=UPI0037E90BBE
MAEFMTCNRLPELWMTIEQLHLSYLQTDESLHKIEQRNKLEGYIKEYLCLVPHDRKFSFRETADVLHQSARLKEDFSGYRAASAWNAIGMYAANLLAQPWRKEYRELKLFCGFYKHEIEANLSGAELMLEAMGYKHTGQTTMVLDGPIDPDRVSNVSRDSLMAFVECQLLKNIWEEVSYRFNCSWLEVLEFRENHVGTPENAAKGLVYHFHQRQYQEQQHQLSAYHPDTYGTTARFHQPAANCMYGQVQPLHPVSHMGYFNYAPYGAAPPHAYTLPPQPRYAGVISPQQAIPPAMTYPIPPAVHPAYHHITGLHHPVLKSQDLYPTNGHHAHHHHYPSPMAVAPVPLQNGYSVSNPMPSAPAAVQNYNCPVPTGQLIELDAAPPQSSSSETQQTYSATESASSVLIPRSVRHHQQTVPLKKNNERQQDSYRTEVPPARNYSASLQKAESQPLTSGKAKEDGTGTFESWDYVFRNLESQGYSKDLGERPDILSPSPERMIRNHSEDVRNSRQQQQQQQPPAVKDLEETLMELRLEEFHKVLPAEHRPLKINEALQKIRLDGDGESSSRLPPGKKSPNTDAVDGSVSVYDNMSSPPKDNPERERPITIATTSSKSNANVSVQNNKASTRTLPRDPRRYGEDDRPAQTATHYSSATLDPKHLRDSTNHYRLPANTSNPSEPPLPERKPSQARAEERRGSSGESPPDVGRKTLEVSDREKWECVTCTFLNHPSRDICEMCGKSKNRGPEVRPLASGGRECPQCTLVNEKGVGTCDACGTSLKDSPTYI